MRARVTWHPCDMMLIERHDQGGNIARWKMEIVLILASLVAAFYTNRSDDSRQNFLNSSCCSNILSHQTLDRL